MIRRVINTVMFALIFCQSAFAASPLFEIQESGTTLETPAIITICANINGPASCQRYTVRRTNLGIMTTTGRSYTRSGIKMDTSTFKIVNAYCSTTANGYCSLPLNNHTRTDIPITTVGVRLHATPSIHTQVDVTYTQHNITTGGIEPYTYSVVDGQLPAGTNLNTSTGAVSGTPSTPGAFSYTIQVTGALGTTDTASTSGTIATQLVITPTASPDNQVGIAYLQTNVANDGTAPYTFSVASGGSIPAGTTLNTATGTVSGSPTTAGAYSYTINVTDSDGGSETTPAITGTIAGPVGLTATPSTYTEVNVNYSQTNVATNGTAPFHYTLDSGTLPAGTTLDPNTGTVSGTPSVAGPFSYVIEVTDGDNAMAIAATSGTMNAALSTTNPSAVIANAGQTASFSAVASDGTPPYSYQWQRSTDGVTFSDIPGATSASYTTNILSTADTNSRFRLRVTDPGSATATSTAATLAVNTALASSPTPTSPVANAGQTMTFNAGVTGGSNSFTYQWQVQSLGVGPFSDVGTNSTSYTTGILSILGNNGDVYRVLVTDSATVAYSVFSNNATLTVNALRATSPGQDFSNGAMSSKAWDSAVISPDQLTAISCPSTSFCIAVDTDGTAFRYDGLNWTSADKIDTGHSFGLNAVSCTPNSGSFCMAVDNAGNAFGYSGTTWSHQYDDGAIDSDSLNSVSCLGTAFCMVVDSNGGALRYNGVTWSAVSDIDGTHSISSLSCPTAAFCMGVDKAGNAWKYLARAANIAQANSGDDDATEKTPVAQTFSVKARDNTAATYKITGLKQPEGVHIDTNNNLWIADEVSAKVYRLPASANGELSDNTPALVSITNSASMSPTSVVTDAEGNTAPTCVITNEAINNPVGISLDSQGNIYQANDVESGGAINIFEPVSANCGTTTVSPMRRISGVSTSIGKSLGLSIGYVF